MPLNAGLSTRDDPVHNDLHADSRPYPVLGLELVDPIGPGNDWQLQQAAGGPGAVVHYIDDFCGTNPISHHDFVQHGPNPTSGGYIAQRVPFEDAQRGQFRDVDTHR